MREGKGGKRRGKIFIGMGETQKRSKGEKFVGMTS